MDPMKIDLTHPSARIAAAASSIADGRPRWTELAVYYQPIMRRCWIAVARGKSNVAGEGDKERRLASASLERALTLFDDSDLGVIVKTNAREWAEENGVPTLNDTPHAPSDDKAGLAWLFGVETDDLKINAAAAALLMGESSLRMAIRDGRDIRVPLRALLPFVNRAAFQGTRCG